MTPSPLIDDKAALKNAHDIVAIANAMRVAMQGDAFEVACGLVVISKLLVGTDVAMCAALARVILKTVRELVDTMDNSPEVLGFMRAVVADAEHHGEESEPRVLQ
jgi:hypothetical protein